MIDVMGSGRPTLHARRVQLTPQQLGLLSMRERAALRIAAFVNERPRVKGASVWFSETFTTRWMELVSASRVTVVGLEKLRRLRPDRGVLIAANHRSFFDMFMVLTHTHQHVEFCERFFFPVRSAFWYDHVVGLTLNAVTAGMAMYPPVFREPHRRDVTRVGLDFLADELRQPATVVGIHPEGMRGTGPDPYELLPAEPGFGRVVLTANPVVVPVFINGLGNDFVAECWSTFRGTGAPIVIVFGDPVDTSEFAGADPRRLRAQVAVGRKVLAEIRELARVDALVRASLVSERPPN